MMSPPEALLLVGVFVCFLFGKVQLTTICSHFDDICSRLVRLTNWTIPTQVVSKSNHFEGYKKTTRECGSRVHLATFCSQLK